MYKIDLLHAFWLTKVRIDLSTEFKFLINRISIKLTAGSNSIVIVETHTSLDRAVDFNEHVNFNEFKTGTACMPSSDIKGGKANTAEVRACA